MKVLKRIPPVSKPVLLISILLLGYVVLVSLFPSTNSDTPWNEPSRECTSIIVGRLASTDGSTITSHTCDGGCRTNVYITPHATHEPGSMNKIYSGLVGTVMETEFQDLTYMGEIPQVEETYSFLNISYPGINEQQLGIGETTIGGRRELRSREGMFRIEELERIALERTTNARDAISLIGKLVKDYGYCDTGECLTFIDPEEAWFFEIFGPGSGRFGAVWAAVRIPDDHVGVSANIPRIPEIDVNDPDNYMASENVFSLAEEMGWWDPNSGKPFKLWEAYSGRTPFSIREYWVLRSLAPSLNLQRDADELPFTVKPDNKVSVREVMRLFRETYAGSEYDMTLNLKVSSERTEEMATSPAANPWMSRDLMNLFNELKPGTVERQRTIAVNSCAYSTVIQCRNWLPDPIGGIVWFGFDNPAHSPRAPIFAGVTELPTDFSICHQQDFRRDSAGWAFRRVSRLAQINWGRTKDIINHEVQYFEEKAFTELPEIEKKFVELYRTNPEKATEFLTTYSNDFCRAMVHKYWELGDQLWRMVAR
ncbi:dipeptidase [candidate division KSB1 bacterium]